jgi:hypothetical protein
MFRVDIIKAGVVTNRAEFKTMQEATEWLEKIESRNGFGKRDRWVSDISGEDINQAIEFEDRTDAFNKTVRWYHFPTEYTVDVSDITLENNDKLVKQAATKRLAYSHTLLSEIFLANKKLKDAGILDKVKFKQLIGDTTLAGIERCILNGSFETAKELIETLDNKYYDTEQKALLVSMLTDYLAKEAMGL